MGAQRDPHLPSLARTAKLNDMPPRGAKYPCYHLLTKVVTGVFFFFAPSREGLSAEGEGLASTAGASNVAPILYD